MSLPFSLFVGLLLRQESFWVTGRLAPISNVPINSSVDAHSGQHSTVKVGSLTITETDWNGVAHFRVTGWEIKSTVELDVGV